eukprot:gene619-2051_t
MVVVDYISASKAAEMSPDLEVVGYRLKPFAGFTKDADVKDCSPTSQDMVMGFLANNGGFAREQGLLTCEVVDRRRLEESTRNRKLEVGWIDPMIEVEKISEDIDRAFSALARDNCSEPVRVIETQLVHTTDNATSGSKMSCDIAEAIALAIIASNGLVAQRKKDKWLKEKNILYDGDEENEEIIKNNDNPSYGGPEEGSSAAAAAAALSLAALQKDAGLEDQRKAKSFAWATTPTPDNTDGDPALGETMSSRGTDIEFPPPPIGAQGDSGLWPDVEHSEIVTCRSGSGSSSPTRVSMISTRGLHDSNLSDEEEGGTSTHSYSIEHGRMVYNPLEDLPLDSDIPKASLFMQGGSSKDLKAEPQRLTRMKPSTFSSIDAVNPVIQVTPALVSINGSSRRSSIESRPNTEPKSIMKADADRPSVRKTANWATIDEPPKSPMGNKERSSLVPMDGRRSAPALRKSFSGVAKDPELSSRLLNNSRSARLQQVLTPESRKFIRPQSMAELEDPEEVEIINVKNSSQVFKRHG